MTMPLEYARASAEFERFMADFLARSGLVTHHRGYAVLRAVLHVFRAHLGVDEALRFADVLPAVLRAIFVEDWHPDPRPVAFPDRAQLNAEVRRQRPDHTLADDMSIDHVAAALRDVVDKMAFERVLERLPPGARAFWHP